MTPGEANKLHQEYLKVHTSIRIQEIDFSVHNFTKCIEDRLTRLNPNYCKLSYKDCSLVVNGISKFRNDHDTILNIISASAEHFKKLGWHTKITDLSHTSYLSPFTYPDELICLEVSSTPSPEPKKNIFHRMWKKICK